MNAEFRINGKEIETERLVLRAFRQSDLEDFLNTRRWTAWAKWRDGNITKIAR